MLEAIVRPSHIEYECPIICRLLLDEFAETSGLTTFFSEQHFPCGVTGGEGLL
jgi:hypothetical protein